MQEIVKYYLKDYDELLKKYKRAENKYYKKLGKKYSTISLELNLDDKIIKNLFISLARCEICLDDFLLCILKTEIIRKEMKKYEKTSKCSKNMEHRTNRRSR